MAELYITPLQDYYTSLCINHKLLNHNDTTNRVFIRFQTIEDISALRSNASSFFVIFDSMAGQAIGDIGASKIRQRITLLFLKRAAPPAGQPALVIENALQAAMDIMFDFYGRMINDMLTDDCGPLRYLVPEEMTFDAVDGPVEEQHYGWLMTIPLNVNLPAYDATKWKA